MNEPLYVSGCSSAATACSRTGAFKNPLVSDSVALCCVPFPLALNQDSCHLSCPVLSIKPRKKAMKQNRNITINVSIK